MKLHTRADLGAYLGIAILVFLVATLDRSFVDGYRWDVFMAAYVIFAYTWLTRALARCEPELDLTVDPADLRNSDAGSRESAKSRLDAIVTRPGLIQWAHTSGDLA